MSNLAKQPNSNGNFFSLLSLRSSTSRFSRWPIDTGSSVSMLPLRRSSTRVCAAPMASDRVASLLLATSRNFRFSRAKRPLGSAVRLFWLKLMCARCYRVHVVRHELNLLVNLLLVCRFLLGFLEFGCCSGPFWTVDRLPTSSR